MSKTPAPELLTWNGETAGRELRWHTPKLKEQLDVLGIKVIETAYNLFIAAVDYQNYLLLKKSSPYEDDVGPELYENEKLLVVHLTDCNFSWKDQTSVSDFYKNQSLHMMNAEFRKMR